MFLLSLCIPCVSVSYRNDWHIYGHAVMFAECLRIPDQACSIVCLPCVITLLRCQCDTLHSIPGCPREVRVEAYQSVSPGCNCWHQL